MYPIIIIGMHRSGSSLIAGLLQTLGMFMGQDQDDHCEAMFFIRLNDWLLRQTGAAWDNPDPIQYLLEHSQARSLAVDYVRYMMRTPRAVNYMGLGKYLRFRSPDHLALPWGWKDPRNTFTLPFWRDLFPQARVVHIYRHGIDVANSLRTRVNQRLAGAQALHDRRKKWHLYSLRPKRGGFADTMRCTFLEGAFSLWETYRRQAQRQVEQLGPKALELQYEKLVADPLPGLRSLARFGGLSATDDMLVEVASQVQPGRVYAYRTNSELMAFAESVSERLAKWGYEA